MRHNAIIALLLTAIFAAGCTKQEPAAQAGSPNTSANSSAQEPEGTSTTAVAGEQSEVVELVNGQLPGYNPNLVAKEVKWADPAQKAAWEARKAELKAKNAVASQSSQ